MAVETLPQSARPQGAGRVPVRFLATLPVAVVAGAAAAFTSPWQAVPLIAWDAAAILWEAMTWLHIAPLDPSATQNNAIVQEPRRQTVDLALLCASVISLIAVVLGVIKSSTSHGGAKAVLVGAGIATIVISWAMVHTLFTLRYASLYYSDRPVGGVDFNEDDEPNYLDFAYLAFTVGMTYQVSDTNLTTKAIRHTALRHALLSYLFGTVIIAATINLAAGLVK